jgi:hypothetical protein
MPIPLKRCSHCKRELPCANFHAAGNTATGLQSWCKVCQRTRNRVQLISFVCDACEQVCEKRTHSPSKKIRERTTCGRCMRRAKLAANDGHASNYTGTSFFPGRMTYGWRYSAQKRGHDWLLTNEQLDAQYSAQNGRCALTGLKMTTGAKGLYGASLDRIDSSQGYGAGNVQFVCKVVNMMKNKLPEPVFVQLCTTIATHSRVRLQR